MNLELDKIVEYGWEIEVIDLEPTVTSKNPVVSSSRMDGPILEATPFKCECMSVVIARKGEDELAVVYDRADPHATELFELACKGLLLGVRRREGN